MSIQRHLAVQLFALIVLERLLCSNGLASLLIKTRETFKLAELQYLEAKLQARTYCCERLVIDAATGSSLLYIDSFNDLTQQKWPSSLMRADWVGEILAQSDEPQTLLKRIETIQSGIQSGWVLDYLRLQQIATDSSNTSNYTSRSLMMCVAQSIASRAQLIPKLATEKLLLVDTRDLLFLVRILPKPTQRLQTIAWHQRPFQYSSSINPQIAEIVVDVLLDAMGGKKDPKLLDPTCGSGTFLAFALNRGMIVEGWDVRKACVDGTRKNIESFFGEGNRWIVSQRDATENSTFEDRDKVDCLVANLPWGQNTITYCDENVRILERVSNKLREKTVCAFITKDTDLHKHFERLGYRVLGSAAVPPKQFQLPRGNKNKNEAASEVRSSSDCVITIVLSPSQDD